MAGHPTVGTTVYLAHQRLADGTSDDGETDAVMVLEEGVGPVRCGVKSSDPIAMISAGFDSSSCLTVRIRASSQSMDPCRGYRGGGLPGVDEVQRPLLGFLELLWPKRRILEVYANIAEFGDGVYGGQAAARSYFRKNAARLSASEAARLAAVLPSPRRYSAARPGPYVQRRTRQVERQMRAIGGTGYLRSLD